MTANVIRYSFLYDPLPYVHVWLRLHKTNWTYYWEDFLFLTTDLRSREYNEAKKKERDGWLSKAHRFRLRLVDSWPLSVSEEKGWKLSTRNNEIELSLYLSLSLFSRWMICTQLTHSFFHRQQQQQQQWARLTTPLSLSLKLMKGSDGSTGGPHSFNAFLLPSV